MSTHLDEAEFRSGGTLPDGTPEPPIHPLVRFSVKNYVFSIGIFVMVVLLGLVSTFRLGVELLPNFEVPVLAVSTTYPGANPDQVDREVSRRVEDAVSTLSGVTDINTTSVSNQSAVVITFSDATDIDSAANSVSQAVAAIRGALPDGAEAPVVQKFDPNAQPIVTLALLGGSARPSEVTAFAEDTLVPRLQRVEGVADVTVSGGPERQVQVLLDPVRLQTFDLSPARVSGAVGASALDLPAGTLDTGGATTSYSTRNTPRSAADVGRIVVDPATGLRVSDVATVRDASAAASSYARVNGQSAVLLNVRKASGTNSVAVTDNVRAAMEQQRLPAGYKLTLASDTTTSTRATVKDTFGEFLIAVAAVGLICLLFLGRLNTVFAVVLAIPISISAAPLLFGTMGITFNIISLLAIIVAIGIVVDDSIVVAENVQRYRDLGYSTLRSVLLGGSEVFSAVTAASFSLLAVLIPLSLMPGILGQFFKQFGLGIAAAIVLSWLESLLFLTVRMAYTNEPQRVTWADLPNVLRRLPLTFRESLSGVRTFGGPVLAGSGRGRDVFRPQPRRAACGGGGRPVPAARAGGADRRALPAHGALRPARSVDRDAAHPHAERRQPRGPRLRPLAGGGPAAARRGDADRGAVSAQRPARPARPGLRVRAEQRQRYCDGQPDPPRGHAAFRHRRTDPAGGRQAARPPGGQAGADRVGQQWAARRRQRQHLRPDADARAQIRTSGSG